MISSCSSASMPPSGQNRPRCDAVDADFRREFASQYFRQHHQAGFRRAVHGMTRERSLRMNVDQIDDRAARCPQRLGSCLCKEQRCFQFVPTRSSHALEVMLPMGVG